MPKPAHKDPTRHAWLPGADGRSPVDAFLKHGQLRRAKYDRATVRLRPDEASFLQPLGNHTRVPAGKPIMPRLAMHVTRNAHGSGERRRVVARGHHRILAQSRRQKMHGGRCWLPLALDGSSSPLVVQVGINAGLQCDHRYRGTGLLGKSNKFAFECRAVFMFCCFDRRVWSFNDVQLVR